MVSRVEAWDCADVGRGRLRLGAPIWGQSDWVGELFAPKTRQSGYLRAYAEVFDAVEGNSTFYATPSSEVILKWRDATPEDFRFCFKLPKVITHERGLLGAAGATERFVEHLRPLGPRLGPIMIQLPPTFGPPRLRALVNFLRALPRDVRFAVEVRHRGFFGETPAERRLTQVLIEQDVERTIFDARAIFGDVPYDEHLRIARERKPNLPVPTVVEGRKPLLRLICPPQLEVARVRLKAWASRVAAWIEQGKEPHVFLHCPDNFHAPRLARAFHEALCERIELEPMPPWPAEQTPERAQGSLF